MGVNDGFLVECGGNCAESDPRHGRGRKPNHGRTLGRIRLSDEDGRAVWHAFQDPNRPADDVRWWHKVGVEVGEDDFDEDGNQLQLDFRVTCDRCGRVWVFTVDELTARHDELAGKQPPVGVAGVDLGTLVGGSGAR